MITDAVTGEEEVDQEDNIQAKTRKGWSRFFITIEPIKLCIGFTIAFTSGVTIDMIQRNICHQKYNLTLAECTSHNISTDIKTKVEGLTAEVNMMNQVSQGFFPLLLILFIGPWSDINGRKPFILCPLLGYSVYYLCWAAMSFFPDIPVMYMFIPSVPLGLSGSIIAIYVCTWSYTCDNFEAEKRPMRFSISVCAMVTGNVVGNALSGQVVNIGGHYGYHIIFFTSFMMTSLTFLYTLFVVEETVVRRQVRTKLFDVENVKKLFMVMLIKPVRGPLLSALVMAVLLCEVPFSAGDNAIIYLVGKTQYAWRLSDYNLIVAISSVISALSPVLLTWLLMNVSKVSNINVLIFSCALVSIAEVMKALSINQVMFWLSTFAVNMGSTIGPSIDTELSHIVNENDLGKAFTMTSICDALSPLISIPFYTLAYNLFLPRHTLYVFFISAALATLALIASVGLFFKKSSFAYIRQYNTEDYP